MENRKQPEVRFSGYTDDWEERKLSEVANHRGGTAIEKYFDKDGEYKVISIGSYGLDSKYVDQNIRAVSNIVTDSRVVDSGELTMVLNDKTSNGTIIGRSLLIEQDNEYVINQRTEIISPKENFNSDFAYIVLNCSFREKVKRIVQGGTQIYVNYPAVSNLSLELPSIEEQKKIGKFFKQLDNTIALHQRKLDLLKEQKKGFLQKMFPKPGANIPEVRLAGFTDDWKERKLGKITMKIGSGKTPRGGSSIYADNGIPLLRSQNIYSNRVNLNDVVYITEKIDEEMANSRVDKGDVLLNITGASIGRTAVYYHANHANVNQHVCIIRPNKNVNSDFIQLNLAGPSGQKQIDLNQAGGGREGLNFQQISTMSFHFPSLEEQQKIGAFFKQLDDTIALNQKELDLLKETKKGFLQKMFV